MLFKCFLFPSLISFSYFLADEGRTSVIDPTYDVESYLHLAKQEALRISHVLETYRP